MMLLIQILTVLWLGFTFYRRFIKKKPIKNKYEHGLVKLMLINKEVGKTRLYQVSDSITILVFLTTVLINYPSLEKLIAALLITVTVSMLLRSFTILSASKRIALMSLLITGSLIFWTGYELKSLF